MLLALLRSEEGTVLGEVFARRRVTATSWPVQLRRPCAEATEPIEESSPSPYRRSSDGHAMVEVVFWNDDTTSLAFVLQLLRGTFGIIEPEATRLVLAIDRDGRAVVGTYRRDEAERLVQIATRSSRDEGFSLRISVEERAPARAGAKRSRAP